ncbi:MAG: peptide deformylase [Omnitrophica WOR_2 bacterium RIFOXYB2_FULL_38_16]|nr:MAG: peptide deformylase [Omnitrophica WOR_2 bacterium GWA2_37_7]OGX52541.1 MAG: peptide deformylase [Omnitrophica WOR_2 bacterium RIFOXYA12_FULL_38_10]OGX55707.1 MAG: peptide deformylase [Omnitrophica WOR_2 bacterium RIFOXYC2_FULL_38_12]OGX58927.1 MAG: peptide deformylase [Omnitrophica WOR_2 bacterium RIFOXYB2_FULL_38_16]HBG61477.1 peptide deformylase [Candidatus Omnitrophota bacterium]
MITKLKVRLDGDPCLRNISSPVDSVGPGERMLIRSMIATMYDQDGIGLAAPQVGINKRILVADVGDGPIAVINPCIVTTEGSCVLEEGCLSVPETTVIIKRPQKIKIKYTDEENEVIENEFDDLTARVLLHEIDHLDGKLIVDYKDLEENKEPHKKKAKDSPL